MPRPSRWTVLVYLAGDNDLSEAVQADLAELRAVGSTPEVTVVAQTDRRGEAGASRWVVRRSAGRERHQPLGPVDSGDPATLVDFVAWAAAEHPAERCALVIWSHGSGWEPAEVTRVARSVKAPRYTARESGDRAASPLGKALFRSTLERVLAQEAPDRAIAVDDASGHSLDTVELGAVLARAAAALGRPVDLLGLDACLMATLEVACEVAPHAACVVAAQDTEPTSGWPFTAVLRALAAEPGQDGRALGRAVVREYLGSYRGYPGPVSVSALDTHRLDRVTAAVDALAAALVDGLPGAAEAIWAAQRASPRFWHNTLWDLGALAAALADPAIGTVAGATRTAAAEVVEAMRPGRARALLAAGAAGTATFGAGAGGGAAGLARRTGLNVYLPPPTTPVSRFYGELAFARATAWPAMLAAYHGVLR
ncbi:MAG TPA: clostripain-related cysteine peptidase [Acidimicrobiales bacterium]|nr:clostripain-related cysteine peptidase [Acidimicrobiales bacterium]